MTTELNPVFWQTMTTYLNAMDFSYLRKDTPLMAEQNDNPTTITLPELITGIRRVRGGYFVYSNEWTFYPLSQLDEDQVEELEDWLEELRPVRKAA